MKHTITLDDMEITALNILLEGESEIMVESRLNTTGNVNPDRREILLNLVYTKVFDACWKADKDPNNDYDLMKNYDRVLA
tara:strand:+ start:50 stop:289 length:240 start_codon:yes stop_codon:yes gene_type:complete